jgi:cytoplasmic iron level regulating protein YaaA (DUF328/UPF0246 family)
VLTVISPAKTLDFETPLVKRKSTQPQFLAHAAALVEDARALSREDIRALMGVSENIANLNHQRFMDWHLPFNPRNARQSLLAFKGEVYVGLQAQTLNTDQWQFAQQNLRILSGLYGLLRPLDLIQPYRLEMGLPFNNRGGRNLYEFWGETITRELNSQLRKCGARVLVNLASNEYFRAVRPGALEADIVTPVFKERKGEQYKVISFFAKKARGQMARFIIDNELNEPTDMREFTAGGYCYNAAASSARELVFLRDNPSASP